MSYTYTVDIGDGVKTIFPFSFAGQDDGYLSVSNVQVFVAGTSVPFTIPSNDPNKVYLTSAPPVGAEVLIRRIMPKDVPFSDFSRGNPFSQDTLNDTNLQMLYVIQEILDGFLPDGFYFKGDLNMGGHKIINMAPGDKDGDAVNWEQLQVEVKRNDEQDQRLEAIESSLVDNVGIRTVPYYYIATGGETRWQLPLPFQSALVFINGVFQNQNLGAFAISNNGFDFAEPLTKGDEVYALLGSGAAAPDDYVTHDELTYVIDTRVTFLTPEMFGAKGDDVTDDRIPIQAAFDAAAANYVNKTGPTEVKLSRTYYVSLNPNSALLPGEASAGRCCLDIKDGVSITGNGRLRTGNYTGTSSGAIIANWSSTANDVTINGITVDAGYGVVAGRGITGINICDSKRVRYINVKANNCSNNGLCLRRSRGTNGIYGCSYSSIEGCMVDGTYYIGVQCERPEMVNILNNIIRNTGDNGIDVEGNDTTTTNAGVGASIIIMGNNIQGVKNGIFVESLGNVKVDHNFIITAGVHIIFNRINSGSFQNTCIGNTMQGSNASTPSGRGIRFINQIGRILVSENKVSNVVDAFHFADRIDRVVFGINYIANITGGIFVLDKVPSGVSLLRSNLATQFYMGAQVNGFPYQMSPRGCPSNYPNRLASNVEFSGVKFLDNNGSGEDNFQRTTGVLVLNTSWNAYARYDSPVAGNTTLNGNFGSVGEYLVINGKFYLITQVTSSTTTVTKWDGTAYTAGNFVADFDQAYTTSTRRAEWGSL